MSFGAKSAEEQAQMVKQIGDLLTKHGIPADVKTVQEVVCDIKGSEVEHNVSLVVRKELPMSMKPQIEAFTKEVQPLIEGVKDVTVQLVNSVGAGMKYQTIENVTSIHSDDKVNLEHDG